MFNFKKPNIKKPNIKKPKFNIKKPKFNFNTGVKFTNLSKSASIKMQQTWQNMPQINKNVLKKLLPDSDRDGVPNGFDCQPFNPKKQDDDLYKIQGVIWVCSVCNSTWIDNEGKYHLTRYIEDYKGREFYFDEEGEKIVKVKNVDNKEYWNYYNEDDLKAAIEDEFEDSFYGDFPDKGEIISDYSIWENEYTNAYGVECKKRMYYVNLVVKIRNEKELKEWKEFAKEYELSIEKE